jgi:tRNA pseudouridine38-40 synthase
VHALAQVAHVDLERPRDPEEVRDAVNFHLKPARIAVLEAAEAPVDFHARFSATGRRYLYRLVNRRAPLVLDRDRAWSVSRPLDAEAMHGAAQVLVGSHDFSSFRDAQCQAKSPVKTLDRLDVSRTAEEISIRAEARSFLHHQVRNMVGTLKLVGEGKWTEADVAAALAARDRSAAGPTAPAEGLYLTGVSYDPR